MNKHSLDCVCCGLQWMKRPNTKYDTGTESMSIIYGIQLLSEFGKKRIQLSFCDKHGNDSLRHVTRYVNGTGVLQIKNVISHRWRNAENVGIVL